MQKRDIKKKLLNGDYKEIAFVCDCSTDTVEAVMNGRRNSETKLGKRILEVSQALVENREQFRENFKNVCNS